MSDASAPSELRALVRDSLRSDAPQRETAIARFVAALGTTICLLTLATVPVLGFAQAFRLSSLIGAGTAYYLVLLLLLNRGWFHPAVPWINVALEVSAPAVLMAIDATRSGPVYALTAPGLTIWGALIVTSALRANRALAYVAGGLAAVEYLIVYALLIHPQLQGDFPFTMGTGMAMIRAVLLFYSGVATAAVAGHLLQKSEDAFRALREQDLMGKYLLGERLGVGGMAEVFRATYCPEGGFQKSVAVKRVLPAFSEDPEFVRLFREEARLGAMLNHPNIVQVLDVGSHRGQYFLALEFVDGLSLSALIDQASRPLPVAAVTYLALQLAHALEFAHARTSEEGQPLHLVHRDLNPPNVLVSRIGEVKLSDFGIARAASRVRSTRAGMVRGKAQYLAPEQVEGDVYDGRADLFALGLTLHEALTGTMVIGSTNEATQLQQITQEDVAPPSVLRSDVPPELDAIIAGLLHRNPSQRTANGRALRLQLERLTGDAAPYPMGQGLLATAVRLTVEATTRGSDESEKATATQQLPQRGSASGLATQPIRKPS